MRDVSKMPRKELESEIKHLAREQEEYEKRIAELEQSVGNWKRNADARWNGLVEYEKRIPELEAEVREQARLNGMGSEREARLMARVAELETTNGQLKETETQLKVRILEIEENVRFYRNEWESACERDRYGQERIKELEAEIEGRDEAYNKLDDVNIRLNARIEELEAEYTRLKAAILEAIRAPTDVSRMVADLKMAVE